MCGVLGFVIGPELELAAGELRRIISLQFKLSDSRGKEASGWAVRTAEALTVLKKPISGSELVRSLEHRDLFGQAVCRSALPKGAKASAKTILRPPLAVIGHSRLVTNGRQTSDENNQPVVRDGVVAVHNGIIVNHSQLWDHLPDASPETEIDTEVALALLRRYCNQGDSLQLAMCKTFDLIEGAATIAALLDDQKKLALATNTGSLYLYRNEETKTLLFASEQYIIQELSKSRVVHSIMGDAKLIHVQPGQGYIIDLDSAEASLFDLSDIETQGTPSATPDTPPADLLVLPRQDDPAALISKLRRCTRCILPETFPFIKFDEDGVCNYCHQHVPLALKGEDALAELADKYRSKDGSPDCLVAVSGGRDSCYGLHYIKTELNLNPIAFTFDWGMVTDLARRNQARMCGKLGVEHILVSADINVKRRNIRRNIEAWLKKPNLGMVPLFMAGDKMFFHYAHQLQKQTKTKVIIFFYNPLEKTSFKTGFCGVTEPSGGTYLNLSLFNKAKLTAYYLRQHIINPSYLNRSLLESLWAYVCSFMMSHDFLRPFKYIPWDEKEITDLLINQYDWETATDLDSTWRIGDGTAAFYNYIYYTVAGFTENDTFRSNQIREGMMTRDEALKAVQSENQPRWESMRWYADVLNLDLDATIAGIDAMPKLYAPAD